MDFRRNLYVTQLLSVVKVWKGSIKSHIFFHNNARFAEAALHNLPSVKSKCLSCPWLVLSTTFFMMIVTMSCMCYCAESLSRTGTSAEIGPHLPDWLALGTKGVKIGSAISIIPTLFVFLSSWGILKFMFFPDVGNFFQGWNVTQASKIRTI